ncbi:LytTR family transcriptional regulator DNA-binding domain-containing protein [Aequorivita todarodis]|uniref:LytR/AlgR family response regulator transcription factor n=1 Tax=Aequorivita todarodis TaxID=2036821 RepID=UPI00235011A5|nr:LytTR family transcriptional regulator DNA-binding domain-containing protein [Aequorivita todarodis]MDC8002105.1 LytTR family transcriptional regulator DNA-binding domain-containing protein [Aequorivita todarodis]
MKALKIYIVEDEPLIVATITSALKKHGFHVLGDSDEYDEALPAIENTQPDLVLVDIQLEGAKDGIDLASALDKRAIPYLYLTSQTDPETIKRVKETQPLGYIVKPFTENGLRSNIELAWHNFSLTNQDFILLKTEGRTHRINQDSILYLKAFDNYCYVVTASDTFLVPHTLKKTSEKLNRDNFIQTHRSYWVNIKKISSTTPSTVYLGEEEIPVSASHKDMLLSRLQE